MIQDHKLRGIALDNLGSRLMLGCANSNLEVTPREKSWLNPNAAGKGGVGKEPINTLGWLRHMGLHTRIR